MEWLWITLAIVGALGLIALGYWWVARIPGDGFIKDITKGPWGGGV